MNKSSDSKPFYKKGWFVAVAVVVVLAGVGRAERRAAEERGAGTAVTPGSGAAVGGDKGRSAEGAGSAQTRGEPAAVGEAEAAAAGEVAAGGGGGAAAAAGDAAAAAEVPWRYAEREDPMTGQVTRTASAASSNSHELGFPYQGGTAAKIVLRKHPRHGVDALVSVSRGQITCSSFRGCGVMVRFDEREPIKFKGVEPSDFDSTMVFVEPAAKFIKEAKRAKKAAVELEFFQEGTRVFLFDVGGLVWE